MKGHVLSLRLQCSQEKMHSYSWSSSPYLPNDEYLVNHRICHGLMCSGMLPSHYTRFSNGSGLGCINWARRKQFLKSTKTLSRLSIKTLYKMLCMKRSEVMKTWMASIFYQMLDMDGAKTLKIHL